MICTQVVAIIPPKSTYASITAPTLITAHSYGQPEHQRDQIARADHLREHVEEQRQDAAERRRDADRHLPQPERHDVGEGELAEVAQRLGDEKHQRRPADEPAGRVDHPVVAAQRHQAGDAEKRRRAHVIAGQREAVLKRTDRSGPPRRTRCVDRVRRAAQ